MVSSSVLKALITSSLALNRRDFIVTPTILISSDNNNSLSASSSSATTTQETQQKPHPRQELPFLTDTKDDDDNWKISFPLERFIGGTNCIRVALVGKPQKMGTKLVRPKRIYKLIVDTGSPYLTIPIPIEGDSDGYFYSTVYEHDDPLIDENNNPYVHDRNENTLGLKFLFQVLQQSLSPFMVTDQEMEQVPFQLDSSKYSPTEDIYGTKLGVIEWKQSQIYFRNNRFATATGGNVAVFGVLDETLASESGGPLLGLVKRSNPVSDKVQLRPTILDQMRIKSSLDEDNIEEREVTSFQIDSVNKMLTILANKDKSLIPKNATNVIQLVDLRKLGDFVDHYAFKIDSLSLNNGEFVYTPRSLSGSKRKLPRSIVAVFDTGLTGCLFTQPLWEALMENGVKNPSTISGVQVSAENNVSIAADEQSQLFYVSAINLDWFDDSETAPFVVVLGQAFLAQGTLTIDINRNLATFEI